jgi:hypothetical protein
MAGHYLANKQAPARLIPKQRPCPRFDIIYYLSTTHLRFTLVRLYWVTPDALKGTPFSVTLSTNGAWAQHLTVVCDLRLHGDHGGPTSIPCTTPQQTHHHFLFWRDFLRSWRTAFGHPVTVIFVVSWICRPFWAVNAVGIASLLLHRFPLAASAEYGFSGKVSSNVPTGTSGTVLNVLLVIPALLMNVVPTNSTVTP